MTTSGDGVRLSEFVAALSLATDLGLGLPQEHVLRQTLVAARIAELTDLPHEERVGTMLVSLMAWIGCMADSREVARWFGDDIAMRGATAGIDKTGLPMMRFMLARLVDDGTRLGRLASVGRFLASGLPEMSVSFTTHCQTTGDIADRLGLDERVSIALGQVFERWDGKGTPRQLAGEQIETMARIVQIADDAEAFAHAEGVDAAVSMLRRLSGREFDPALVDLVVEHADTVFAGFDSDPWQAVVQRCDELDRVVPEEELDDVLAVLADFADLKSPWWLGHSRAVSDLAGRAAAQWGLSGPEVAAVRRAGLVHRLGAVGVSNSIWDKTSALTPAEVERVRQVPYLTRRVLARQPLLARLGALAGQVRERIDGSGYPAGLEGEAIGRPARVLAAAQAYQSLSEDRPHRPGVDSTQARRALESEARSGRLDPAAVDAVLSAAGHRARRTRALPAGLTQREVEVLGLLARGLSNREIAQQLTISQRTVGTHVEHVYAKAGVSTRGAAAMFAMRHGVVDPKIG